MVSLTRSHPKERGDWACGVALDRQVFRYSVLRRLVDQATPQEPLRPLLQQHPLIRDLSEYAKEVSS